MKRPLFADLSLLFVAFVWGVTFVLVQNAIALLPPISFNAVRFLIATLIIGGALFIVGRRQIAAFNRKLAFAGILIGICLFLGYATQTIGLLYTSSSKAGFITGLSVVLVPLLAFFVLKQRPSRNAMIGVFIATIGLYLLTMIDITALNKGDGFVFIGAVSFTFQIIFTGKYSGRFPTLLLTFIQLVTVTVCSFIFSFIFEDWRAAFTPSILLSTEVLVALIVTAVFATALAFFAQTYFQKFTTPTRVALIFATEPVFAAIAGYLWAGDRLSTSALIGCICILAGMLFAELPLRKLLLLRKRRAKAS